MSKFADYEPLGSELSKTIETVAPIVKRVLKQDKLDAHRALAVLAAAMVGRHVDVELRKYGKKEKWSPGNERTNALVASMDALFESKHRVVPMHVDPRDPAAPTQFGPRPASKPMPTPDDLARAAACQTIIQLLTECQFAVEHKLGLDKDDEPDDEPPRMRLVTD
jgi:hypothetical protein